MSVFADGSAAGVLVNGRMLGRFELENHAEGLMGDRHVKLMRQIGRWILTNKTSWHIAPLRQICS